MSFPTGSKVGYDRARMARKAPEKLRPRALQAVLVLAFGCVIPVMAVSTPARADTEEAREEAKRLFAQGSSAFLAKRYADALEDLRASYKLVPSPNSGLLIARCLRELNRRVEAVDMYATVAADARRRAADGDAKYAQTADVAASEGAAVRATLGMVRVRVSRPPPGSHVEIDGVPTPATEAEIAVLHAPGEVTVKWKPRTGAEQSQRATLVAGGDLRIEFTPGVADAPPPPARPVDAPIVPSPRETGPPAWTVPAVLVSTGVALVGAGVFVGFGLKSASIYDNLRAKCGAAGCGEEDRATADSGKRDQTIANVGLGFGIAGAAAAIVFLVVRASAPRSSAASPSRFVVTGSGVVGAF
jgi:hypothetical protein